MGDHQPPSPVAADQAAPLFFIGRDSHGNWVAQDTSHRRGGIFVDRAEAVRFARAENGKHLDAVVMVPGVLELDLDRPAARPVGPAADLIAKTISG